MRLLKSLLTVLLAAFAIAAGLVVSLFVAVAGAAVFLGRRMARSKALPASAPRPARATARPAEDAIEVVATEVPADSTRT